MLRYTKSLKCSCSIPNKILHDAQNNAQKTYMSCHAHSSTGINHKTAVLVVRVISNTFARWQHVFLHHTVQRALEIRTIGNN